MKLSAAFWDGYVKGTVELIDMISAAVRSGDYTKLDSLHEEFPELREPVERLCVSLGAPEIAKQMRKDRPPL